MFNHGGFDHAVIPRYTVQRRTDSIKPRVRQMENHDLTGERFVLMFTLHCSC